MARKLSENTTLLVTFLVGLALLAQGAPAGPQPLPPMPREGNAGMVDALLTRGLPAPLTASPSESDVAWDLAPHPSSTWSTTFTLFLGNDTALPGNVLAPKLTDPGFVAYDPDRGLLYVSDATGVIFELEPNTLDVVGELTAAPAGNLAYLSSTKELYVESYGSLDVIDPSTDALVASIPVPQASLSGDGTLVYVPGANAFVVGSPFNSSVAVVNMSQQKVVATVPVGASFNNVIDGSYDPVNHNVYLADYENNQVMVLSSSTWTVTQTITISSSYGLFATGVLADPLTGNVFVSTEFNCPGCGGSDTIVELYGGNGSVMAERGVGSFTSGMAFDPGSGLVYVADASTQALYALLPSNLTVVHTVALPHASALMYGQWWPVDAGALGAVYVAEGSANAMVKVAASNGTVLSTLWTGISPNAIAEDPACGGYAVTDTDRQVVYLVDSTTLQVKTTTALAGSPYGIAYDSATQELFVTLGGFFGASGVEVLNATTGNEVTILSDGSSPSGIAYDPTNGLVYVADYLGGDVRIFNGSNLTQVGLVTIGNWIYTGPTAVTFDPANNEVYVTDWNANNLTRISGSTDQLLGNISVGSAPTHIAYDPGNNRIYVSCLSSNNVTVVDPTTERSVGSIPETNPQGLAFDPTSGDLFVANDSSNLRLINTTTGLASNVTAGAGTVALLATGGILLATDTTEGAIYQVATGTGTAGPLSIVSFHASPASIVVGDTSILNVTVQGGAPPLHAAYSSLPPGCQSADTVLLVCAPTAAGSYNVTVAVSDAQGHTASAQTTLVVGATPSLVSVSIDPPAGIVQVYRTLAFSAAAICSPVSCPSSVRFSWTLNSSLGSLSSWTGTSVAFTAGPTPGVVELTATAALDGTARRANVTILITSTPPPVLQSVSLSPLTASVGTGGSLTLTATPSCSGGSTCPTVATVLVWSVSNALGTVSPSTGTTTTFTAGGRTGVVTVTVVVRLDATTKNASAQLTVIPSRGTAVPLAAAEPWLILGGIVAVAVIAALLWRRRRGKHGPGTALSPPVSPPVERGSELAPSASGPASTEEARGEAQPSELEGPPPTAKSP